MGTPTSLGSPGSIAHGQGDELAEPALGGVVADRRPVIRRGDDEADDRRPAGGQGVGVVGLDDLAGHRLVAEEATCWAGSSSKAFERRLKKASGRE